MDKHGKQASEVPPEHHRMVHSLDFSGMDRVARAAVDAHSADRVLFDIGTALVLCDYRLCAIHRNSVALGSHMYVNLSGDKMVQKKEDTQANPSHEKGAAYFKRKPSCFI